MRCHKTERLQKVNVSEAPRGTWNGQRNPLGLSSSGAEDESKPVIGSLEAGEQQGAVAVASAALLPLTAFRFSRLANVFPILCHQGRQVGSAAQP